MTVVTMTRMAELCSFDHVGQVVFLVSSVNDYQIVTFDILQGKQESNPH